MVEQIIIGIIFFLSIGYLLNIVRKNFSPKKSSCAKGCGTCSVTDLKKAETSKPNQQLMDA